MDTATPRRIFWIAGEGQNGFVETGDDPRLWRFNQPRGIALTPDGVLLIADRDNRRIRRLIPSPGPEGTYQTSTWIGGANEKDCGTGVITGKAKASEVDLGINASLSAVCVAIPSQISVINDCARPEGKVQIAFTQHFAGETSSDQIGTSGNVGHIVRVTRPCPP